MILAASCEFDKRHNSEIIERITDNEEVPAVSRCQFNVMLNVYNKIKSFVL